MPDFGQNPIRRAGSKHHCRVTGRAHLLLLQVIRGSMERVSPGEGNMVGALRIHLFSAIARLTALPVVGQLVVAIACTCNIGRFRVITGKPAFTCATWLGGCRRVAPAGR
jgi:sorbitol-specific phosphotransferase system component IIC